MSERNKEIRYATVSFAGAILFLAYAMLGKMVFGALSLYETKELCVFLGIGLVLCGALLLIGDKRLNAWINPRLKAIAQKWQKAKEHHEELRTGLDQKDPSRVTRREVRKARLFGLSVLLLLGLLILCAVIQSLFLAMLCFILCMAWVVVFIPTSD